MLCIQDVWSSNSLLMLSGVAQTCLLLFNATQMICNTSWERLSRSVAEKMRQCNPHDMQQILVQSVKVRTVKVTQQKNARQLRRYATDPGWSCQGQKLWRWDKRNATQHRWYATHPGWRCQGLDKQQMQHRWRHPANVNILSIRQHRKEVFKRSRTLVLQRF